MAAGSPMPSSLTAPILLEATNVLPVANGFAPVGAVSAVSQAVGGLEIVCDRAGDTVCTRDGDTVITNDGAAGEQVRGAINIYGTDGTNYHFAGTETGLWTLDNSSLAWTDVTRTSGGAYATATEERWRFAEFGNTLIATNYTDAVQAYTMGSSTEFAALGGSPPKAVTLRSCATLWCWPTRTTPKKKSNGQMPTMRRIGRPARRR